MTVYGHYDVIAFRSCIQIFTVNVVQALTAVFKAKGMKWLSAIIKCIQFQNFLPSNRK